MQTFGQSSDKETVVVEEAASTLGFLEGKLGAACAFTGNQSHDGFEQSRVLGLCRSLQWKNDQVSGGSCGGGQVASLLLFPVPVLILLHQPLCPAVEGNWFGIT